MSSWEIHPVTPERWDDLVALFSRHKVTDGCWCMWFRQTAEETRRGWGPGNRAALEELVRAGRVPGLLAYADGRPVGWVSVAPRDEFGRVERSRILKPVDDEAVWSVVCFFVDPSARGGGLAAALLEAAVDHAAAHGARLVEGYPVDRDSRVDPSGAYYGVGSMFRDAGFTEVARRKADRPIVRRPVDGVRVSRSGRGRRSRS